MQTYKLGILVEGVNDAKAVFAALLPEEFPHVMVAWNNGTQDGSKLRHLVNRVKEQCPVIYALTDPDAAGDILAEKMLHYGIPRIYVDKEECMQVRLSGPFRLVKRGVEYASPEYLREVICKVTGLEAVTCSDHS